MQRYLLPALAAAALIAIATIPQGIWSRRFGAGEITAQRKLFAERLNDVPTSVGDWDSKETPVDPRQIAASGSDNSFSRRFQNRKDPSKFVDVFIVCGAGRDVTTHTPEQCYVLNGYQQPDTGETYTIDAGKNNAAFITSRFRRESSYTSGPQNLRIFWSFNEDGKWEAPTVQKLLAGAPALYKIYAITELPLDDAGRPADSVAVPFLREFLPALTAKLFPPEAAKDANGEAAPSGDSSASATSAASDKEPSGDSTKADAAEPAAK